MSSEQDRQIVRIDLTAEQKQRLKDETGKDVDSLELTVRELEARIAPRLVANHNETLLIDTDD
jgi:hypothetical protein